MRVVLTAVALALVVATPPLAYAAGREPRNGKPYACNPRAESLARAAGLKGRAAAQPRLCDLDGKNGRLAYVGYDIDELARKATFEEVTYLLLYGELPKAAQLDAFTVALTAAREIPRELTQAFRLMPKATDPMRVLQAAVAGAVGALKGPLHGGAGEAVMRTLMEIGEVASVDAFTEKALAAKRRLMGFGHRVYKAGDPRAAILRGMAEQACRESGQFQWYQIAVKLHERIGGAKGLIPNVDFYSAPLFYSLAIPVDLFTPVIAAGRLAGWSANIVEQHDDNRLIRPRADYVGPGRRAFVDITKR